jgi:hypothetical protein
MRLDAYPMCGMPRTGIRKPMGSVFSERLWAGRSRPALVWSRLPSWRYGGADVSRRENCEQIPDAPEQL